MALLGRARAFPPHIIRKPLIFDHSADASITLGALALSASGALTLVADLSQTLGTLTVSSAGGLAIAGNAAVTLGAISLTSAGSVNIVAAANVTLGTLTLSSASALNISGGLDRTLGNLTISSSGSIALVANLSRSFGPLALSADGTVGSAGSIFGEFNRTFDALTLSADGTLEPLPIEEQHVGGFVFFPDWFFPKKKKLPRPDLPRLYAQADIKLGALMLESTGRLGIKGNLSGNLGACRLQSHSHLRIQGFANIRLNPVSVRTAGRCLSNPSEKEILELLDVLD